LLQPKNKTPV